MVPRLRLRRHVAQVEDFYGPLGSNVLSQFMEASGRKQSRFTPLLEIPRSSSEALLGKPGLPERLRALPREATAMGSGGVER